MSKRSGLGQQLFVGGYDLSGDIGSLSKISGSVAVLDVTGINKFAFERIGGLRDGAMDFMAFFNTATGQAHPVLSALPRGDVGVMMLISTTLGDPAACLVAKQLNYDGTRATSGAFTFNVGTQANGFGIEWGKTLTAGKRTDTAATNGTSVDGGATNAPSAFGLQAYLQVMAFTGTDVTVKIQDSADNATFADLSGAAFTQITSTTPQTQRIAISNSANVRRYLRASTVTTGGFTSLAFAVAYVRNPIAGQAF
ncbi:hypothetical protein Caci_2842 [Catenulispora acidiphila DSM 44928]|uniref:Uncharacterized protein n=1 Tax=Catenulispora acidiphila (strain DSM 44928 / JCM 14897 / NBRC 102108 / NRRL B-24433 / ID139908) TaxID=479433 RepID=C7Q176_CATAD|nr:hypothetical protein Caci_2842 [Catenulispora acidiphila DSM 44928]